MRQFYTSNDIERRHKGCFFSPDTMKFFKSRVLSEVFEGEGGVYFVTSEKGPSGDAKRMFTVRQYNPLTDNIKTIGKFNRLTRYKALKLAKEYSEKGIPNEIT